MPSDAFIQYGSFGLVVFVVAWFVLRGFPQMITALTNSIERVLTKIDAIEADCRKERMEMMQNYREERDADRKYRQELSASYQVSIARMFEQAKNPKPH